MPGAGGRGQGPGPRWEPGAVGEGAERTESPRRYGSLPPHPGRRHSNRGGPGKQPAAGLPPEAGPWEGAAHGEEAHLWPGSSPAPHGACVWGRVPQTAGKPGFGARGPLQGTPISVHGKGDSVTLPHPSLPRGVRPRPLGAGLDGHQAKGRWRPPDGGSVITRCGRGSAPSQNAVLVAGVPHPRASPPAFLGCWAGTPGGALLGWGGRERPGGPGGKLCPRHRGETEAFCSALHTPLLRWAPRQAPNPAWGTPPRGQRCWPEGARGRSGGVAGRGGAEPSLSCQLLIT